MAVTTIAAALGAAIVLAGLGCASLPPCPARGGPAWSELRSTHFDLLTDLDAADAQVALRDLEELRGAVLLAAWRRAPEPPGRIVVFVLRNGAERNVFVPGRALGAFVSSLPLHQSFLVTSGNERAETLTEGLVYALCDHYRLFGKAHWFDVGLSEYLGPLTIDESHKLTYGQIDPLLYRGLTRGHLTSFENLWKATELSTEGSFNATGWIVVHYLFNHEPARFEDFQRLLIATNDARFAWAAAFRDLTDGELDRRLDG